MNKRMKKRRDKRLSAVVPGSYDPVTNGHMFLITRAAQRYGKVYAAIFVNENKQCLFSREERLEMLRAACAGYKNVVVDADGGMLYEYAQRHGIAVTVRGYRNEEDLRYEKDMAARNRAYDPHLRTLLIPCEQPLQQISSSAVRKALKEGSDCAGSVPGNALPLLYAYIRKRGK